MSMPMITVITLSYNSAFLLESIDSVLMQTYPYIQYIIVDDGSSEFDREEIHSYIEKNKNDNLIEFEIVAFSHNIGTVKAFNIAIKLSKGEFLFNLASDDAFFDTDILEDWVQEFLDRDALIMTGQSAVYDISLENFKGFYPTKREAAILKRRCPDEVFRHLSKGNFIYGCCTARSRKLIEQHGGYDEDYRIIEDYPLMLSLSRQGVVIDYWEHPVVKYRQGGISSPDKFNSVYEKDSDLIFAKEILPYVEFKGGAKLHYYRWKCKRRRKSCYQYMYQEINNSGKRWRYILLFFIYPISTLRQIKRNVCNK